MGFYDWICRLIDRPSLREIFKFWDGQRHRYADPLAVQRELDKAGGKDWQAHIDVLSLSASQLPIKSPELIN